MALDDSRVPRLRESGGDGVEVALQVPGESLQARQVGGGRGFDPCWQLVALQLGEHVGEGADVSGECVQFGAVGQYVLELDPVSLGQCFGAGEDPAGDGSGGWRAGTDWLGFAA